MARTKAAKAVTYAETTTAVIGSVEYTTLQLAIDNVADNETVQLVKSVSESVTIPENKTFTLDLGSNTLTNTDGNHTINNKGTVTIMGSGTVDNISNEKAALWNDGTATLTGNTYTRSQETGIDDNESGGNSYYTIVNHGAMTINDGTNVNQNGKFSSLVENGWYNGSQNTSSLESVLTVEGGTFTGGLNTIKNDDYGKLTINSGSFTNMAQSALLNWNDATITNGTFTADETSRSVVINGYIATETDMDKGSLNIQGGTYSVRNPEAKAAGVTAISLMGQTEHCGTITISGNSILNGDIKTDAGKKKGGSLTISGTAQVNGQIENSKFDVVNVNGGTITQGIVNNGPGTISVTDGTVEGGIQNASNGFTYISGGTIDGGVTQALPNAVTEITGGTFTNYGDTDFSEFVPEDSKFDPNTGTVSEKVKPEIEIINLPSTIVVNESKEFSVHTIPNDYLNTTVEVTIGYEGLNKADGDLKLEYYDSNTSQYVEMQEDRFGPNSGFPLQDLSTNFRVTPLKAGSTEVTLNVVDINTKETLCSTSQSVTFEAAPVVTKYMVTVTGGTGSGEYEVGASVTCVATIPEGKEFDVWQVEGLSGAVLGNSTLTFAMPANDVTCTAKFKDKQPQPSEDDVLYITVEEGDSIWGFARRFKMSVDKIMADNNITEYRRLYSGEIIKIYDNGNEVIVPHTDFFIG